jgi:hypothetical protein
MKRVFAAVLAVACVVGSTPSFARGGFAHGAGFANGSGRGGFGRNPGILFGTPAPQMPAFENRIPAPLSAPAQAPIINGPCSSGRCL